jgi:hypothetical protein
MKHFSIALFAMAVLAAACTAQAAITAISVTNVGGVLGYGGADATIYKDFNPNTPGGGLGPIDVNVTVDSALNPYTIWEATTSQGNGFVHNYSGQTWTDFHFKIDTLEGGPFTFSGCATDVFATKVIAPTTIDLFDGTVPVGNDFHPVLRINAAGAGRFTIHETATVPEPSTVALLALAAFGLLGRAIRNRRKA